MKTEPIYFIFGLIVFLFYIPMGFYALNQWKKQHARRRFHKSVITIIEETSDDFDAIDRIKIAYRRICEIFPHVGTSTKSYGELLEDLYYRAIALPDKTVENAYGFKPTPELRSRIAKLIEAHRSIDPFASVSSKFGNLLLMTQRSIETKNEELGENSLGQLSQEIEVIERRIKTQEKQNFVSMVISVVGVILTVIFGAISLMPLIKEANKAPEPTTMAVTAPAAQQPRQP